MSDSEGKPGRKDDPEKKKGDPTMDERDNVNGGYAPGQRKKKSDPRHHHENR